MKPHAIPESLLEYLRYVRSIPCFLLRSLLRRKRGECTWCGGKIPPRRQHYCDDECRLAVNGHCHPVHYQDFVIRRDGSRCVLCGHPVTVYVRRNQDDAVRQAEVDHIVPVVEGGGFCGPENLRTLCDVCHKKETAALRKRLAS